MADDAAPSNDDAQISFKVKTSGDKTHTITMAETATVLDLKNKLAGTDYEDVAADRQRLIYSGRVMKNEEPLSTYKIKPGNTVHMVKSAASNATQNPTAPAAAAATQGIPTNMAAGTANNPLAGLTGARYAGHLNLPGREMFGADGGMGAPPSEDQLVEMLSDPNAQQMMNEALNNPQMIDYVIRSNPMLRNLGPDARNIIQSPMFRQVMTNPDMIRQVLQMRRMFGGEGGAGGFPAPGVTDTTTPGAGAEAGTTTNNNNNNNNSGGGQMPPFPPFGGLGGLGGAGMGAGQNPFSMLFGNPAFGQNPQAGANATTEPAPGAGSTPSDPQNPGGLPPNPFASLFGQGGNMPPPSPEALQQAASLMNQAFMSDMFGGAAGGAAGSPAPPDSRPPEERYAEQLRQLNDMGFYDFDRNVEALRRAGGSVQGAIEQLLMS